MWRPAWALGAAMLAFSALAQPDPCAGGAESARAQGGRHTVHFRASPPPAVGRHFTVLFSLCEAAGAANAESVTVDARMPSHGHGMNYRPTIAALGGGRYRAEGLMFHMPGEWELTFVVRSAGASERITHTLVLGGLLDFAPEERAIILRHGPWPPPLTRDPSNRLSGNREAARLGKMLFFDTRLSTRGTQSCASCHDPARAWTDARATAVGHDETRRNTQSVLNARFNRWFGWGGAADSLWSASLRPLMDAREMGAAERHIVALVRSNADLVRAYRSAFGRALPEDDEELLADIGKALAAFQETLVTRRTPFDDFRDALARGDARAASRYPLAAQRGVRLFVGKAQCNVCHFGSTFSNGEFDKVGIPVRDNGGYFDWGRYDGIKAVLANRFNRLSRHSDDPGGATSTRHVALDVEAYGAFKVPGLRNVALTAPYMHNGSLATLRDVVTHYSEITPEKLHIAAAHPHAEPGEPLPARPAESPLRTLSLTEQEVDDIVAFLHTLSEAPPRRVPR